MNNSELIAATLEAKRVAHTMPIYGAPETDDDRVFKAVRSSMRACAASGRYMELLSQCKSRGIAL